MRKLLLVLVLSAAACAQTPQARTAQVMRSLRSDPLKLRDFLHAMPKGGDLHNHLSGAVYAESYLEWAAGDGMCIDTAKSAVVKSATADQCDQAKDLVTAKSALTNPALYSELLGAMSMYQYLPAHSHDTGHDHFFAAFPRFGAVSGSHWGDMLAEVTERAAEQHELYLELILGLDHNQAGNLADSAHLSLLSPDHSTVPDIDQEYRQALAAGIKGLIPQMEDELNAAEVRRSEEQRCAHLRGWNARFIGACAVQVRYIYEVYRAAPPERVFAQMIAGFELASADPRVVAVNLVQPEDWLVPVRDYALHMRMLDFLHQKYPKVHITLHAGELAPGLVPYEALRSHIAEAIHAGHAERIGHGTDILYEHDHDKTMAEMAKRKIAVEINLTSNRLILGVSGKMHPLQQYLRAGVPLVISTDDEGVARSEMTEELMAAVLDQGMTYEQLKQAEFDSLLYSFADDATKQKLVKQLETDFAAFERDADRFATATEHDPKRTKSAAHPH